MSDPDWSHVTGLRLTELVTLPLDQVDLEARRISLVGKGDKERVVPVPPALVAVLEHYVSNIRQHSPTPSSCS